MLQQISQLGRKPDLVPLTDYADDETFRFLLPKSGWTFDQWRDVNREVAAQLRSRGFNVHLVRLELQTYMDWLIENHLENTPANRAQFAAEMVGRVG